MDGFTIHISAEMINFLRGMQLLAGLYIGFYLVWKFVLWEQEQIALGKRDPLPTREEMPIMIAYDWIVAKIKGDK